MSLKPMSLKKAMEDLMRGVAGLLVLGVTLLAAGAASAETRCTTRPATGGGTITSCHETGTAAPAVQFRTREATGGGTITTGAGRACVSRPAVGGGVVTSCR
jgi:hypothetical protein